MSWICLKCETENPDKLDCCEVCNSQRRVNIPKKLHFSFTSRYYVLGKSGSFLGGDLLLMGLPGWTQVREMLTDKWILLESLVIPQYEISESSYYYVWGKNKSYKLSEIRRMGLSKLHPIRKMLTDFWFTLRD